MAGAPEFASWKVRLAEQPVRARESHQSLTRDWTTCMATLHLTLVQIYLLGFATLYFINFLSFYLSLHIVPYTQVLIYWYGSATECFVRNIPTSALFNTQNSWAMGEKESQELLMLKKDNNNNNNKLLRLFERMYNL